MPFNYEIEVAVPPNTSNTERGGILESFAKRFLKTQNYSVTEQIRFTASEVDLLGIEKSTSEAIFVECKAHRSNISAEVLQKLLGNVIFKNYSSGWLISTYHLSKDAKGFQLEWAKRPPEERRKIRIYTPDNLIERLVQAGLIRSPESLAIDKEEYILSEDAILLLTTRGEYWALPILDPNNHVRSAAALFDAKSGKQISDDNLLEWISTTDTTVTLPWIASTTFNPSTATNRLTTELESIVRVPVADHWSDYRPARPEDYVGRESIQAEVFDFFDKVRNKQTGTRLIAIKAPSGWGKSSSVLKLAAKASNIRNRNKYFVFTADSRAASTRRFPELAVITAIKDAISSGFFGRTHRY